MQTKGIYAVSCAFIILVLDDSQVQRGEHKEVHLEQHHIAGAVMMYIPCNYTTG